MFFQNKIFKIIVSKPNRILSVLLCVSIICGLMSTNAFANTYDLGDSTVNGVEADGVISDGEYSWTTGKYDRNSEVPNQFSVITPHTDTISDGLWAQYWVDYDEEYIYIAYKERGDYATTAWVDINPRIGMENTTGQIFLWFTFSRDDSKTSAYDASCGGRVYTTDGSGTYITDVSAYIVDAKGFYYDDGARNQNTVEIKLDRNALATYAGAEFDSIGFRGLIQSGGSEALYYDGSSSAKPVWFHEDKGYKKIELSTEESNSRIDGVINSEEYSWTTGKYDRNSEVSNQFSVITPHTDTISDGLWAQYWVDYDEDYIYVAYKERGDYATTAWVDINPRIGMGNTTGQIFLWFTFSRDDSKTSAYDASCGGRVYATDGSGAFTTDVSAYIVDAKGFYYDDGERNQNTVEIKLDRNALTTYAGAEFDSIGFRGLIQSCGSEALYYDGNSSVKPIWFHEDKGYKKINLSTEESNSRIDGVINSEEYYWISQKYDRNVDVDNEYKVIAAHTDTTTLTTQYFVDFDDDYIYLGYTDRVRGYDTDASIDLAPILNDGKAKGQIHLDITANTNGHSVTGVIYKQDGTTSDVEDYIVESAATGADDGLRYNNYIEICLDRKAISQYAGAEFDKIGILGVTRNYGGIGVYGNASAPDDLRPVCEYEGIGYHIVNIAYNVWVKFNATHHIKNDGAGNITYGFHDWSESNVVSSAKEFEDGQVIYTCSVCGVVDSDVIPATGHHLLRVEEKAPNCTETGFTQHKDCEYCEYKYKYEVIPVNDEHVYDDDADMECNLCEYTRGGGSSEGGGDTGDSGNTGNAGDSGNSGNTGNVGDSGNGESSGSGQNSGSSENSDAGNNAPQSSEGEVMTNPTTSNESATKESDTNKSDTDKADTNKSDTDKADTNKSEADKPDTDKSETESQETETSEPETKPTTGNSYKGTVVIIGATLVVALGLCIVFLKKKKMNAKH